mgnify:CR=1 FL=1
MYYVTFLFEKRFRYHCQGKSSMCPLLQTITNLSVYFERISKTYNSLKREQIINKRSANEINKDLSDVEKLCGAFALKYENKLTTISASGMLRCLQDQEKINGLMGRLMSFASLRYYQMTTDTTRAKFLSDIQDKITEFSSRLVFFTLEFNSLKDSHLTRMLNQNSDLARYKTAFVRMRAMKPYQLNDDLENFLHQQSVVGAAAWNKLFDETISALKFDFNNEELSLEEILHKLNDNNRVIRKEAAESLSFVLNKNINLFSRITNTLIKEKSIEDKWRKFPTPQSSRHLANDVEPEVVDALRNAVVNSYSNTSHRYYKLKAKWLNLKKLQIWDRNAPLPNNEEKLIVSPVIESLLRVYFLYITSPLPSYSRIINESLLT